MKQHSKRRHRGILLTLKGWDKLTEAKTKAEINENCGVGTGAHHKLGGCESHNHDLN